MKNIKILFLLLLLSLNIFIYYSVYYISGQKLMVAFLDVGQGDAIFVKSPNGRQLLIDGGANNAVLRELGSVMPFYDRSLDVVLVTHADQDHIGGLVEILKRFKVDLLVRSNTTSTSAVYKELERVIKEKNIKEKIIITPNILDLGSGVYLDIIFPNVDTFGWETNEASIVGKLVYGQNTFLLMGDSPKLIEKYLVEKYGRFLASDVLKVGHHGSKNSSLESFISQVSPQLVIISAGQDNSYGHPHKEVLDIFNNYQIKILETLGRGMIKIQSDGVNLQF